jgi:RecG-like helicase
MDRLVIGDVGYGKTEVALRAAALAALAGKQVVIAAPTTVLVRQHFETFSRRFERTGLKVASLSRLSDAAERKRVKAGLADGSIAVVVGTAAVAGKDVSYAKLALVVIDEEQRFGANDKEMLRKLAGEGHVLSLTATPIPRTLQNALLGLKQMSVIATPPARRQPIRTFTGVFDDAQVRTALLREKDRSGQSFVVVPRIQDLGALAEKLQRMATCRRARSTRRWSVSLRATAMCFSPPTSSRPASTCRAPTPWWSGGPTASASPSFTSCAVVSAGATGAAISFSPPSPAHPSPRRPASGCARWNRWIVWAPASPSVHATWTSGARAT